MLPAIGKPEQETENHGAAEHHDAVIHALRARLHRCRPHGEEGAEDGVSDCDYRDWHARTSESEGSPR